MLYHPGPTRPHLCDLSPNPCVTSTIPVATDISANLRATRSRIDRTSREAGRPKSSVALIAVSKRMSAQAICEAHQAGQIDFAENYLQEAITKVAALARLPLCWHFIGRIQSNKTTSIARHFQWVHTLDRDRIARRLSAGRMLADPTGTTPLNVLLQVNVDGDRRKGGLAPEQTATLLRLAQALPGLRVRGLMTIPDQDRDPAPAYRALASLFHKLKPNAGACWDSLSMGMSGDLEAAVAAGATQVRIGTAIFGARPGKATRP